MGPLDQDEQLAAAIRNAGWHVRHYQRGGRSSIGRAQRARAITALGRTVRDAFNQSENYEVLLTATLDALRPRADEQPF